MPDPVAKAAELHRLQMVAPILSSTSVSCVNMPCRPCPEVNCLLMSFALFIFYQICQTRFRKSEHPRCRCSLSSRCAHFIRLCIPDQSCKILLTSSTVFRASEIGTFWLMSGSVLLMRMLQS